MCELGRDRYTVCRGPPNTDREIQPQHSQYMAHVSQRLHNLIHVHVLEMSRDGGTHSAVRWVVNLTKVCEILGCLPAI